MPAVWDQYATTATPNDELVAMMGLGYTLPSQWPDAAGYLTKSLQMQQVLGLRARWSLDPFLGSPNSSAWSAWATAVAQAGTAPSGFLLNYSDFGAPPVFHDPSGRPVLSAQAAAYGESTAQITQEVDALVATPPAKRPLVSFIPVTVWSTSYEAVADALLPLEAKGVRFLTPSQAFACLPPAPAQPVSTTTAPSGPEPDLAGPARPVAAHTELHRLIPPIPIERATTVLSPGA